ncbi:ABC-type arginine transport system permease subunit [Actinokineospora baliensis]|uniref:hypothetical protein n=1 Tax=Actinokineospora baliensis TaxID=547056 RepID=UPI00195A2FB7|nr:hypothetical protein [Actinokineospora baliensis]MBM7772131.1 ABC-type arginine transport system permease subunit [Actinokineospora baliensis]
MRVPFAIPAPALKLAAVAVFSVVVALGLAMAGALGHWSSGPTTATTVQATVLAGSPCNGDGLERVSYPSGGGTQEARLDACGHEAGEKVEVTVGDGVVHLARATAGATVDARPFAVVLLIFAGIAGAWFTQIKRRD